MMNKNNKIIELISNESADYEVLRVNNGKDFLETGHSINNNQWIKLLKLLGYKVIEKEISDEDMENDNY